MIQTVLAKKGGVRDSKCSDRFYSDCFPRRPFLELNVDFEVCHFICQSNQEPTCDWFTYDTQEFNKCQMFSNELGTMEDFFESCGQIGGPTRHHDGTCMVDSSPDECSPFCELGCKGCDPATFPCENIHEVNCNLNGGQPAAIPEGATSFDVCKMTCAGLRHSYARWAPRSAYVCTCWDSGDRLCSKIAVSSDTTLDQIDECQSAHEDHDDMGIVILGGQNPDGVLDLLETFPSMSCNIPNTPQLRDK